MENASFQFTIGFRRIASSLILRTFSFCFSLSWLYLCLCNWILTVSSLTRSLSLSLYLSTISSLNVVLTRFSEILSLIIMIWRHGECIVSIHYRFWKSCQFFNFVICKGFEVTWLCIFLWFQCLVAKLRIYDAMCLQSKLVGYAVTAFVWLASSSC